MTVSSNSSLSSKHVKNNCDGCTLCCYLLKIPSIGKNSNELCKDCILNKGCKIYKTRPKACVDFRCAYNQMTKVSEDLRPDNCKLIFEKVSDTIFFGTQDPRFPITKVALNQINSFNKEGFSVIIGTRGRKDIFLAENHTSDHIKKEFNKFLNKRYGRT